MYKPFRTGIWTLTVLVVAATFYFYHEYGFSKDLIYLGFGLSALPSAIGVGLIISCGFMISVLIIMEQVYKCDVNGESIKLLREYLSKAIETEEYLTSVTQNMNKFTEEDMEKFSKCLNILDRCLVRMKELSKAYPEDDIPLLCLQLSTNLACIRTYIESTKDENNKGEQANIPFEVTVKDGNYDYKVEFMEDKKCPVVHKFTKGLFSIDYLYKDEIRDILQNVIANDIKEFIDRDKKVQVELDTLMTERKDCPDGWYDETHNVFIRRKFAEALNLDTTTHLLDYILNSNIIEGDGLRTTEYLTKSSSIYTKATVANTWTLLPYIGKDGIKFYLRGKVIEEVFGRSICYVVKLKGAKNA